MWTTTDIPRFVDSCMANVKANNVSVEYNKVKYAYWHDKWRFVDATARCWAHVLPPELGSRSRLFCVSATASRCHGAIIAHGPRVPPPCSKGATDESHSSEVWCARATLNRRSNRCYQSMNRNVQMMAIYDFVKPSLSHDRRVMELCLLLRPNASFCPPSPTHFSGLSWLRLRHQALYKSANIGSVVRTGSIGSPVSPHAAAEVIPDDVQFDRKAGAALWKNHLRIACRRNLPNWHMYTRARAPFLSKHIESTE